MAAQQHTGQREGLLVAVVDAGEHHVLDEDPPAAALVEGAAGLDHLAQREALVDRHQLGAQRFVGGMQREGEPQRQLRLGEPFDARDPADRRDGRAAVGDADLRQPLAGAEDGVEVEHRLTHAHEDAVVDRFDTAEVQRLVEDLRGAQVATEAHLSGRTEPAGQRAARL